MLAPIKTDGMIKWRSISFARFVFYSHICNHWVGCNCPFVEFHFFSLSHRPCRLIYWSHCMKCYSSSNAFYLEGNAASSVGSRYVILFRMWTTLSIYFAERTSVEKMLTRWVSWISRLYWISIYVVELFSHTYV